MSEKIATQKTVNVLPFERRFREQSCKGHRDLYSPRGLKNQLQGILAASDVL